MFEIIFAIILLIYVIIGAILSYGANKNFNKIDEIDFLNTSIIVAARNEEDKILDCINSLNEQNFPDGKLEILIVDDNSDDNTFSIVESFIQDKPKFKLLKAESDNSNLIGKSNAIDKAIKICSGEIIITTDADCLLEKNWAKTIASYFLDDIAMVCGFTNQKHENTFEGMQAIDFIYLQTVAAGTMNLGKPLSCIGNNMAYRKSVYEQVGGYENLKFSVTEDYRLMEAFRDKTNYKIIYPSNPNMLVVSNPCEDFKSLYWQKKRWGIGGLDSEITTYLLMGIVYLLNLSILYGILFPSLISITLIIAKLITDYRFIRKSHLRLKIRNSLFNFLSFEIYFIIYIVIMPLTTFNKKVKWKGRTFR